MFYYRCKYVLDFYIVLFLSMLSQAVVLNKIFNLLYKQFVFIHKFWFDSTVQNKITSQDEDVQSHTVSGLLLLSGEWRQVDVTLHGGQRFNLASGPAALPLPQAARGPNAEPAVATCFADDLFVVVDVGHASHRHHAGLQDLGASQRTTWSSE